MLQPKTTNKFEKDLQKAKKQGRDIATLKQIMLSLMNEIPLNAKFLDHPLKGNWKNCRECHIQNDWLLIYRLLKQEKEIWFERLGSHSELF